MGKYSIGVDLGGTKVLTGIVDKTTGIVVSYIKKKTKKDKGPEKIIQKIIKSINEVLLESNIEICEIDDIGIGAAGQINRDEGVIINAPNLDCSDLNIGDILKKEFNKEIILGNDVEIATIGEMYFGAGQGETDFVCIFVGTGIDQIPVVILIGHRFKGMLCESFNRHCFLRERHGRFAALIGTACKQRT